MTVIFPVASGVAVGYVLYWRFTTGYTDFRHYKSRYFGRSSYDELHKAAWRTFWVGAVCCAIAFAASPIEVASDLLFRYVIVGLAAGHLLGHFQFLRNGRSHYENLPLPAEKET